MLHMFFILRSLYFDSYLKYFGSFFFKNTSLLLEVLIVLLLFRRNIKYLYTLQDILSVQPRKL